jgi:cytochrome c5
LEIIKEFEMNKKWLGLVILLGTALFLSAACRWVTGAGTTPSTATVAVNPLPAATQAHGNTLDGKALLEERCSVCHSLNYIYNSRGTPQQWSALVSAMIANGAVLNPQEQKILDDYLANTYK